VKVVASVKLSASCLLIISTMLLGAKSVIRLLARGRSLTFNVFCDTFISKFLMDYQWDLYL